MAAIYPLSINLDEQDGILFDRAVELYDKGKSELGREIIHMWLFNNQLQLTTKNNIKA